MANKIQIFFKVLGIFLFHFINSNFSHFGEIWHTQTNRWATPTSLSNSHHTLGPGVPFLDS
jgi:hypothetical protein